MKNKELFDRWQAALDKKEYIIANRESYHYKITVAVEKKERFISFLKWVSRRWTEYHDEWRFDEDRFNHDVGLADNEINVCVTKVNDEINELKRRFSIAVKTRDEETEIAKDISILSNKTKVYHYTNAEIKAKLEKASSDTTISVAIKRKIEGKRYLEQAKILEDLTKKCLESKSAALIKLFETIKSISDQERAEFLAKIYFLKTTESTEVAELIMSLGFDANHLAYIATVKDDKKLFEIAVDFCADKDYAILESDGNYRTLLQYAINNNKTIIANEIIAKFKDLATTLLKIVDTSDFKTLEFLINLDKGYVHQLIHGYSMLHRAICTKNLAFAEKILMLDPTCINDQTSFKESNFKIALRSSSEEMIKMLENKVELYKEVSELIQTHESALFTKALKTCTFTKEEKQKLLLSALEHNDSDIIRVLLSNGANIEELSHSDAISDLHDSSIMYFTSQSESLGESSGFEIPENSSLFTALY